VSTATPDLVEVRPGVYVVANYDEPVFYSNDAYWRYDSGRWYRSNRWGGGWSYARPPRAVLSIERPQTYVRYRPSSRTVYRDTRGHRVYRDYRSDRRSDRDHRDRRDRRDRRYR
jgi:hypothetical protein